MTSTRETIATRVATLQAGMVGRTGNRIASALGILTGPSDDVRAAQTTLGLDVTAVNADDTTGLPMPTVVLLDADGILRWIDVHPDYTTRTETSDVLAAADRDLV